MCSARRLMVFNVCVKFHENMSRGFKVMERTRKFLIDTRTHKQRERERERERKDENYIPPRTTRQCYISHFKKLSLAVLKKKIFKYLSLTNPESPGTYGFGDKLTG